MLGPTSLLLKPSSFRKAYTAGPPRSTPHQVQDIANDLNVKVRQAPVTVQLPVGFAVNVCPSVNADVLAKQRGTAAPVCTATNNSTALAEIVQRQMNQQSRLTTSFA